MLRLPARSYSPVLLVCAILFLVGCGTPRLAPEQLAPDAETHLPPVPFTLGDLKIDVVYPAEGAQVEARDSNFIFGSVGRGDATLTIDGVPVEVAPNGGWLAFLPLPADGVYRLRAGAAGQVVTASHSIRLPAPRPVLPPGEPRILEGSIVPRGPIVGIAGEEREVRFRGTPGGTARLILPDGTVIALGERPAIERRAGFMLEEMEILEGTSEYYGRFALTPGLSIDFDGVEEPTLTTPTSGGRRAMLELSLAGGTERMALPVNLEVLDPSRSRLGVAATSRPDGTVIARRQLGADQAWDFFWPNGTRFGIDGEESGFYRVRLAPHLSAWVAASEVQLLGANLPPPQGFIGPTIEMTPGADGVDLRFAVTEHLPFLVDPGERELSITFYGATGRPAYIGYGPADEWVRSLNWEQPTDDEFRFTIELSDPLWGFRYHWEESHLVLRLRRPPAIDPARPLHGIRVALDAGHRAGTGDTGAIGPTRLHESEAALTVVQRLRGLLEASGAIVIPIRVDSSIVPLIERPRIAIENDAHLTLSVHFNAFPDGVDPFRNQGTTNFYYWPHSLEFARALQRELVGEFGLPDRGVRFQNLAMPRISWMPSVLSETFFMMVPEQESALRDPQVVERVAQAHVRALEDFLRRSAHEGAGAR